MISSVRYMNFKRYSDTTLLLSKKLTVLVGPNSSGKSSLLKGLLAFKQTYEDPTDHTGFLAEGAYVDIGHFDEYVRNHDNEERTTFIFELTDPPRLPLRTIGRSGHRAFVLISHETDPQTKHGRVCEYSLYFSFSDEGDIRNINKIPFWITYKRMQKSDETFKIEISEELFAVAFDIGRYRQPSADQTDLRGQLYRRASYRLNRGDIQAKRDNQRGMLSSLIRGSFDEPFNIVLGCERIFVQPTHARFVEEITQKLFALAALREKPSRSVKRTDERQTVGSVGENTASVYYDLRQRSVKAGKRNSAVKEDFERLDNWFSLLNLGRDIEINSWRDLIDMRTRTSDNSSKSDSVVDIGVGFSQAAPILVQIAAMPDDGTLIMEQPELHLYPWAQSQLGQIFCAETHRTAKRLIIETHSEHLIGGIQLHVSGARGHPERGLQPSDIQILYIDTNSSIRELELDEYGEFISEWPSGFFDQTLKTYQKILSNKLAQ